MTKTIKLKSGLYVTATPIGNMADMSARAIDVLNSVDLIACEDKRVSGGLMQRFGIKTPMISYHDHNGAEARPKIIDHIKNGEAVALISDAGTPLISDPGYKLVDALHKENLSVFAIPGPSSPMAALMVAGLPSDRFLFMGFLPHKEKAIEDMLQEVAHIQATLIFLESPKRLAKNLKTLAYKLGETRGGAVCRELTKLYEEVRRGSLGELLEFYANAPTPKGEIVLLIAPPEEKKTSDNALEQILRFALDSLSVKEAATVAAYSTGVARKEAYQLALKIKDEIK